MKKIFYSFLLAISLSPFESKGQYLTLSGVDIYLTLNGEYSQNICLEGHVGYMKDISIGSYPVSVTIGGVQHSSHTALISRVGDTWELWSDMQSVEDPSVFVKYVWDSFVSDTPSPPCGSILFGGTISSSSFACYTPNCVNDPTPPPTVYVCSGNEAGIDLGNPAYWYESSDLSCTQEYFGQYRSIPNFTESKTYYLRHKTSCGYSNPVPFQVIVLAQPTIPDSSTNTICNGSVITLHSTCENGEITWYDSNVFGTLLGSGNSFITQVLNSNITFYAGCESSCGSSIRASHTINVNPNAHLNLSGTSDDNGEHRTSASISSTQIIQTPIKTTYSAGGIVELLPGFKAENGTVFKAVIGGCD